MTWVAGYLEPEYGATCAPLPSRPCGPVLGSPLEMFDDPPKPRACSVRHDITGAAWPSARADSKGGRVRERSRACQRAGAVLHADVAQSGAHPIMVPNSVVRCCVAPASPAGRRRRRCGRGFARRHTMAAAAARESPRRRAACDARRARRRRRSSCGSRPLRGPEGSGWGRRARCWRRRLEVGALRCPIRIRIEHPDGAGAHRIVVVGGGSAGSTAAPPCAGTPAVTAPRHRPAQSRRPWAQSRGHGVLSPMRSLAPWRGVLRRWRKAR